MAFADFRPYYLEIKDQSGAVRGQVRALNDSDLSLLWQKHEEAMEQVFELARQSRQPDAEWDVSSIINIAARTAPDLITDVITLASGEADWAATAAGVAAMPFGLRIDLLAAVFQLTVHSEGGLEKLFGLLGLTRPATSP